MGFVWLDFVRRLKEYPNGVHLLLNACPEKRILDAEREFGRLPRFLREILGTCNGGELFINAIPLVTLFGISPLLTNPEIHWHSDWYIDTYTRSWRSQFPSSECWVFAMTNYGGLLLLSKKEEISEWDTNTSRWNGCDLSIEDWLLKVITEGDTYMTDEK